MCIRDRKDCFQSPGHKAVLKTGTCLAADPPGLFPKSLLLCGPGSRAEGSQHWLLCLPVCHQAVLRQPLAAGLAVAPGDKGALPRRRQRWGWPRRLPSLSRVGTHAVFKRSFSPIFQPGQAPIFQSRRTWVTILQAFVRRLSSHRRRLRSIPFALEPLGEAPALRIKTTEINSLFSLPERQNSSS